MDIVINQTLSDEMISAGADLTRLLDEAEFPFSASLWFFTPDGTWRFVIASSEVRTRGPRWAYRQVQSVLSRIPNPHSKIPLKDITILDSDDLFIKSPNAAGVYYSPNLKGNPL